MIEKFSLSKFTSSYKQRFWSAIHNDRFCLINLCHEHDSAIVQKEALRSFCHSLGCLLPQNRSSDELVDVIGTIPKEQHIALGHGRGSDSEGLLTRHTDNSPEFLGIAPPKSVGLACIVDAETGGETFFVHYKDVFEEATRHCHDSLLGEFLPFDRSKDFEGDNSDQIVWRKIMDIDADVKVRYSRLYIRDGIKIAGGFHRKWHTEVSNIMENCIDYARVCLSIKIPPGSALFWNNHSYLHGRNAYVNRSPEDRRWLVRVWLNQNI